MAGNQSTDAVIDANGNPVPITEEQAALPDDVLRQFFAGRVPASGCPHYIAKSEADAGFTNCERC